MRKSILYIVLASLFVSMLFSISFLSYNDQKLYRSLFKTQQIEVGLTTLQAIQIGLEKGLFDYIQSTLSSLTHYEFFVGAILYGEDKEPILRIPELYDPSSHPILGAQIRNDFLTNSYNSVTEIPGALLTFQLLTIADEVNEPLGYLLLTFSSERIEKNLQDSLKFSILIDFIIVVAIIFFLAWKIKKMLKPLENAVGVLEAVAEGDYTQKLIYDKKDEIGRMAISLNTATLSLKEKTKALIIAKKEAEFLGAEAEKANIAKSDFLANMSHEIRTPMNGVIGMTNLLLKTALNTDQYKLAKTVKSSGESLLNIINDILDFSKIESGKLEIEYLDFNLGQMVEDMGSTIAYQSEEKGLELICPANPVISQWIKGDPGRIRQILINLIGNAIKFTGHGEIAVYVHIEDKGNQLKQCHFQIKDTGIGISEVQQNNLFRKFTQADSSTTRKYGGTGLGLSISKKLVELMGGEIGVNSVVGEGSTFWFNFDCEGAEAVNDTLVFDQNIENQRVLIVDDNETNRELMRKFHELWGIKNTLVACGKEALAELEKAAKDKSPYDIAILDMHMPEMDGLELGRRIKANSEIQQTKLIMATSQGKRGDANTMKNLGFNGYLTKPIHQSDLFAVIRQVCGVSEDNGTLITRYTQRENTKFKGHVLVVEDSAINQMVIEGLLEDFGMTIHFANNGEEALSALRDYSHIELVFMDCQMPVMDGYEATKKIRDPSTPIHNHAIPVVAMTANAMAGDREKCLKSGMDDYISKPIDPNDVRISLEKWLPKNRQTNTSPATDAEQNPVEILDENVPIFDFQAFSNRMRGNEKRMRIILGMFYEDFPNQIVELKENLETSDIDRIKNSAHTMKGSSANVGAMALSCLALELELAGNNGELVTLHQKMGDIEKGFSVFKQTVKEMFY